MCAINVLNVVYVYYIDTIDAIDILIKIKLVNSNFLKRNNKDESLLPVF